MRPGGHERGAGGQVGPSGRVIGIERDEQALAAARSLVEQSGVTNVELRAGNAADTGIEPGSVDVAMMRHVLAHNGGHEQSIVDHLATLPRAGGAVYLVDVDLTAFRMIDADPELDDLSEKYVRFHSMRGNDPKHRTTTQPSAAGRRPGGHQLHGGLQHHRRPARNAATRVGGPRGDARRRCRHAQDFERWNAAFARSDAAATRPKIFAPGFVAIGRKSSHQRREARLEREHPVARINAQQALIPTSPAVPARSAMRLNAPVMKDVADVLVTTFPTTCTSSSSARATEAGQSPPAVPCWDSPARRAADDEQVLTEIAAIADRISLEQLMISRQRDQADDHHRRIVLANTVGDNDPPHAVARPPLFGDNCSASQISWT